MRVHFGDRTAEMHHEHSDTPDGPVQHPAGALPALEESCTVAGSFVAGNQGARAFYQALGYCCVAHVPRYYQGIEAAIRMARDLSAG